MILETKPNNAQGSRVIPKGYIFLKLWVGIKLKSKINGKKEQKCIKTILWKHITKIQIQIFWCYEDTT